MEEKGKRIMEELWEGEGRKWGTEEWNSWEGEGRKRGTEAWKSWEGEGRKQKNGRVVGGENTTDEREEM